MYGVAERLSSDLRHSRHSPPIGTFIGMEGDVTIP